MRKDIVFEKVVDVAMAVVPEEKNGIEEWHAYLLNLQPKNLEGLIVSSKGYGNLEGKDIRTSTLRQFFENVSANDFVKIELIDQAVLPLNNEFWISYWQGNKMFDKKFVFVSESIIPGLFTDIPLLNKRGVMIR